MTASGLQSNQIRRRLLKGIGGLLFAYVSIAFYFHLTQVEKIFRPRKDFPSKPDRMGLDYKEVDIPLSPETGKHLDAFWVPAKTAEAPIMLYLHGQDATRGKNLEHTESLHECGYHVLILDYRGYGESFDTETPSELKVYEDAVAALKYLLDQYPSNPVFIYGHSLGGAVAIELATRDEAEDAAGLIVESTFTSISEMSALQYGGLLQLLPVDLLLTERFDSVDKIESIKCPIHLIHGKEDSKVPFQMSRELSKKAPSATLHLIDGAGHEDCCLIDKVEYRKRIKEFVSNCLIRPKNPDAPKLPNGEL